MPALLFSLLLVAGAAGAQSKWTALIIDGQNNHRWQETTPLLKKYLEETGLFTVEVATSPPAKSDMSGFQPQFKNYQVVVSNYNGERWPAATERAFEAYVRGGGGFVVVHAANNAFPDWPEFNRMIALGGWGGRNEKSGALLLWRDGKITRDPKPGPGGHHGPQHTFAVTIRDPKHPITRGLPEVWMHAKDELYDSLRGPGENVHLLATAYSDRAQRGTGEHEPMLFTVSYGKGRVFHTALGHSTESMSCLGFIATYQRGTEWAASGKVRQKPPKEFPSPTEVKMRP